MIPKLHKKGTSFKGAATYLLHDKGSRKENERVEWTATRNLATERPDAAWRVMAATAMDADRRKAVAGIKATGRKSKDSVLHLTLSWHPDEAAKATKKEMLRAADEALKALGADDRQVLIVCHNDEPQPHVHLLINRVSAEDGRMLSSSKEKLALSKWAQSYEQEHGRVVCPERVKNNARRSRGEFVRGKPEVSRQIFEQQAKAKGNEQQRAKTFIGERLKDASLAADTRAMHERHRGEWDALKARHKAERKTLRHQLRELFPRYTLRVEKKYISQRDLFDDKQRREFGTFAKREKSILGRMSNQLRVIDFKALLSNKHGERKVLRQAFKCLVSSSARMDAFKAKLRNERREFEQQHKKATKLGKTKVFAGWRIRRVRVNETFGQQKFRLFKKQDAERTTMAERWATRNDERRKVFERLEPRARLREKPAEQARERPSQQRQVVRPTPSAALRPFDLVSLSAGLSTFVEHPARQPVKSEPPREPQLDRTPQPAEKEQPREEPRSLERAVERTAPVIEREPQPSVAPSAERDQRMVEPQEQPPPPTVERIRSEASRSRFRGDDDDYGRERRRR